MPQTQEQLEPELSSEGEAALSALMLSGQRAAIVASSAMDLLEERYSDMSSSDRINLVKAGSCIVLADALGTLADAVTYYTEEMFSDDFDQDEDDDMELPDDE
jgi:hypothetical protein